MKKYVFTFIFSLYSLIRGQVIYTQNDVDICQSKFTFALEKNLSVKPINEIIIDIGKSFVGTDYAAQTLEYGNNEQLVISLSGLDCYTFLESCLVFARCIKLGKTSFEDFQYELRNVRYRNGVLKEYPSRLHYFSDWIYDLNRREIIKDVTKELGGVPYKNKVDFMTTHPSAYRQLVTQPKYIDKMILIEEMISTREYYYIPQEKLESLEKNIDSGDIIGITTNIDGLDIAHTGIAIRMDDGRIHLMHSPNVGKKVQITIEPLVDYIKKNKTQTGIMVARPVDPLSQ